LQVTIQTRDTTLEGILTIPDDATSIVVFAHGSGSSRLSPRNTYVAQALNEAGLATLLFDLLTSEEEKVDFITREFRFDIELLSRRLIDTIDWVTTCKDTQTLNIGTFGSSTGAASALIAAAERPDVVKAVVSRGGRPDLAGDFLPNISAASLLIVGGLDETVIQMNKDARDKMNCEVSIDIIPGATHLFEEPGTLDQVIQLTADWFTTKL